LHFYFINVIQDGKKTETEFKDWKYYLLMVIYMHESW
jgi:hypothetical protein